MVEKNKTAPKIGKRTFKGKVAIVTYVLEQALKHDVQFAKKLVDELVYDDHRLVITDDGKILLFERESQLKKKSNK
jgi:hypothetical protein